MAQQRKRCSYDLSFKLKAIESAEKTSKEAAARQFGVDARRIREWCGQKTKLMALKEKPGNSKPLASSCLSSLTLPWLAILLLISSTSTSCGLALAKNINIKRRPRFNAGPVLTPGQRTLLINKRPGI